MRSRGRVIVSSVWQSVHVQGVAPFVGSFSDLWYCRSSVLTQLNTNKKAVLTSLASASFEEMSFSAYFLESSWQYQPFSKTIITTASRHIIAGRFEASIFALYSSEIKDKCPPQVSASLEELRIAI